MGLERHPKGPVGKRLRDARLAKGLSQKELGVSAGIDMSSASARINQYERHKHVPDYGTAQRLASVLDVPVMYLYADDDELAELVLAYSRASLRARAKARSALTQICD